MNFNTWFTALQTRTARNAGAGLVAFKALLARLGHPERTYKIIHVAGTNGKGTVCTLLAHTLTCAGYKTGLFVSPHLVRPTERIKINGEDILSADFVRAVDSVLGAGQETFNFFELLTAAALLYFAERKVSYVVLETGLGGRKDPTNVCEPVLSIITSIGLDHTALLGDTLSQIAREKAGIIKPQVSVLCGAFAPEAATVIEHTALEKNAPLTWIKEGNPFSQNGYDFEQGFTHLRAADGSLWNLHLLGEKQPQNACLVYHAARQLNVPASAIKNAFETVQFPGRFERIKKGSTTFILDGAHNLQAMQALLSFWSKTPYASQKVTLLCGFMKDKDYQHMLTLLSPHFTRVIVTVPPSSRAATQTDFGDLLNVTNLTFEPDYQKALTLAQQFPVILCTGSFYLVGGVRGWLGS